MRQVIDYSLKLNPRKIAKSLFFTMLLTFVSFFLPVFASSRTDINKIKSDLSKGVNISFLEQYWLAPDILSHYFQYKQVKINQKPESKTNKANGTKKMHWLFPEF